MVSKSEVVELLGALASSPASRTRSVPISLPKSDLDSIKPALPGASKSDSLYLTVGSTWSAIWKLSWPMMLNMMILAVSNLFEGWVAGRLGPDVQSAVGIASQIWFFVMLLTIALSSGTIAVLSRYYGAQDHTSTVEAARQSLLLSVVFGSLISVGCMLMARPLVSLLAASPAVADKAWYYLEFTGLSALPYTVLWISNSIFRAKGDSRTAMFTMLIVSAATIGLDYILCLEPLKLGISGIGLSWLVASVLGIYINVVALRRSDIADCLDWSSIKLSTKWTAEFLNIGLPACMQDISLVLSSFGLYSILGHCADPVASQAAWAAGWRLEETATIMPMYGLNMAAATIVGQNLGARKAWRAMQCGWQIVAIAALINVFVAIVFYAFAAPISAFMSDNADVRAHCINYLKTISWTEPFFASWLVLSGCLQGAARTRYPMVVTIVAFDLMRLSLAWYLSIHQAMGASGTWIAMAASSVVAAIWMARVWSKVNKAPAKFE